MPDHPMQTPPRPMTDQEAEERAQAMYDLDQQIRSGIQSGRSAMWAVARALAQFDAEHGWSALGYDTLSEYLADPDINMTRRTYQRYVRTINELDAKRVKPELVESVDVTKVDIVLPAVKAGAVKLREALDDAQALGARDLRDKYVARANVGVIEGTATDVSDPETDDVDSGSAAAQDSNGNAPDSPEPAQKSPRASSGQRPAVAAEMDWHERVVAFLLDLKAKAGDPKQKRLPKALIAELDALLGNE